MTSPSEPDAGAAPRLPAAPFPRLLLRAVRLRCVVCGTGRLFRGIFRMPPACDGCGYVFQRTDGGGYFLGSIYFNYIMSTVVAGIVLVVLMPYRPSMETQGLALFIALGGFSLWFHRYARALFMALDVALDPPATTRGPDGETRVIGV